MTKAGQCSQPLPYNSIRDFQIRQVSGRSRVDLVQQPSRMNNYSALLPISDSILHTAASLVQDHPVDAEPIPHLAEPRREERLFDRHQNLATLGKRGEYAFGFGIAVQTGVR
jgi:hypothetical protein